MRLASRIGYYLGGFALGLLLLFFFLGGKKASCDYGPNARVLKNLRSKKMVLSPDARTQLRDLGRDSADAAQLLQKGSVLFGESQPRKEPCALYMVESTTSTLPLKALYRNCEDSVEVVRVSPLSP